MKLVVDASVVIKWLASMDLLGAAFVTWDQPLHAKLARSRFAARAHLLSDVDRLLVDLGAT